jgi:hypothetical protein
LDTQNAGDIWVPILMMIKTSGKTAGKWGPNSTGMMQSARAEFSSAEGHRFR